MSRTVTLVGGPFDGERWSLGSGRPSSLLIEMPDCANYVARYRPTRDPNVLRFREYDRVAGRIEMPEAAE